MLARAQPGIAFLPWGGVAEDWLEPLGLSIRDFADEFVGSYMFGYVEALATAGVRTVLICTSREVRKPERLTHGPTGAPVWVVPPPKAYWPAQRLASRTGREPVPGAGAHVYLATPLRTVARVVREERCRALLCSEYEYPRFDVCVQLGRLLRLPVFATFQGGTFPYSRVERPVRGWSIRTSAGVIIATRSESDRVRASYGVDDAKIGRIFNPVDVAAWTPLPREEARRAVEIPAQAEVVVWHGRMERERKGLDLLIEAWRRVVAERPDRPLELLLVGTGAWAAELRELIASGRAERVRWIDDFVNDRAVLRNYLTAADVFVLPSRHEGFPVAPIEAMACGLPVVASDVPGIPDILEGEQASGGMIVPAGDVPALAQALGSLLDDPAARSELGRRARLRVETEFSYHAVGQQLRAFFEERGMQ